ncbi:hypothetical protein BDR05DRAFT_978227 [Suillus weaverae]|nr:hypothetical protein BDR05DRAFT_978227 [Suillus weaverae]
MPFFKPVPSIKYTGGRRSHIFKCMAKGCKQHVHCYLDKGDAKSTGNMAKHAKTCWGEAAYQAAQGSGTAESACETHSRKGRGKVTYSHRQHSKTEAHAEIIQWLVESLQPFETVNDCGFQALMKTRRPKYHIPSPLTVSQDVKLVFSNVRQ